MTTRKLLRLLPFALTLMLTPGLAGGSASAGNETAPACMRPDTAPNTSTASYILTKTGAQLSTVFALAPSVPTCPGATYTFTVASVDGTPLGWTGSGTVSADGTAVTQTFVGDGALPDPGAAIRFAFGGSTDRKYVRATNALRLSMTTSLTTATYTWTSPNGEIAEGDGGAGSFYN